MPKPLARAESAPLPDVVRLHAVGSLIWRDRALLLATAARARGDGRATVVECKLRGGSMATAIPARSRIRVTCGQSELRVGDVAAFLLDERLVVHRIAYRRRRDRANPVLITRGDAMVLPDPPVAAAEVLGHVVEFDPGSGWQTVGAPCWKPRRKRLLGIALLAANALMLEISVGLGRRFAGWLESIDRGRA